MTATTDGHPDTTSEPTHRDHDCGCGAGPGDHRCDPPKALQRNTFFPRKLMEVRHWQAEQAYHRRSRELVTRLGLGSGVLCGLGVQLTPQGSLVIGHGVGVDGHGRMIVVPKAFEVDPSRVTDSCGRPSPESVDDGIVTVSLCFHECGTDLVRMPPEGCDDEPGCVPSMVREAYAVSVTRGVTRRHGLPDGVCDALCDGVVPKDTEDKDGQPTPKGAGPADPDPSTRVEVDRRRLLDRLDPRTCACQEDCIPLATVELAVEGGPVLDTGVRTVIRSNRELLDLILCLADRLDECCTPTPVTYPPRVVDLWPWPDQEGQGREQLVKRRRLELAFDRDMAEQGLDDPGSWLGVWLLDRRKIARRLAVQRAAGVVGQVTAPAGGEGAAYSVELDTEELRESAVVVVMARSVAGGTIRAAAPDQLALDAELAATGLSPEQRDKLWAMTADGSNHPSLGTYAADAILGPPARLPTGDGTAGGELHIAYRPAKAVVPPPRLLSVWPPGAVVLNDESPESRDLWKRFLERPRAEITVSRALAAEAIADPRGWLRLWHAYPYGELTYRLGEIGLGAGEEEVLADGSVRYLFPYREPPQWQGVEQILTQLRSTPPLVAGSPVGREDPVVLLDADFSGTVLDSQTLFRAWDGDLTVDVPALQPLGTDGEVLYDGLAGGLAHWGFTFYQP
jgi:hypothetical protein